MIVATFYIGFGKFEMVYTKFGWSFNLVGDIVSQIVGGGSYFAYNLSLVILIYIQYRKAKYLLLKRKLKYLLLIYSIFQFAAFYFTNLIQTLVYSDLPPFGGFLQILTFLTLSYVLTLKSKIIQLHTAPITLDEKYNRFLNNLLHSLKGSELGEKYILFSEFVKTTDIEQYLTYVGDNFLFKANAVLNLLPIIEKTLDYIQRSKLIHLLDSYLPVINSAYTSLSTSERHSLDELLLKRAEFLLEGDVFYGIDGGRLLQKVEVDKSLNSAPDTEAALRIYKRILLATFTEFKSVLGSEFLNRLPLYEVLKDIEVDVDGYISITNCLEKHKNDPPLKIILVFNSFLSQAISQVEDASARTANTILGKINRILELNWRRASKLGIISTFRTSFGDLLSEPITMPLLNEPITTDTLRASLLILGKPIEESAGKVILLEFTASTSLQLATRRLTVEALAKGYDIVVFTRKGSLVEETLTPLDVKYVYLTLIPYPEKEANRLYVPLKDPTEVLTALSELNPSEKTVILFDNLTDLILTTGFDKTYTLLRHIVELAAQTKAVILLGLNKDAHEKQQVAALEALVNLTINLEKAAKLLER
ncbi:MAG: hypothetical protein QXJ86_03325 [Nitrososphaerales archaeon]